MEKVSEILENPIAVTAVGVCAAIGAVSVLKSSVSMMGSFSRHCLRSPYNHYKRYAKDANSYVVVTGGSDGIGFEICNQMAEQGFNVCIISRTLSKIEDKCKEL
jgi:17beta-estradiol 17-dehydrogenase / very-long-chain 3-oxoacyl-CoA reductase